MDVGESPSPEFSIFSPLLIRVVFGVFVMIPGPRTRTMCHEIVGHIRGDRILLDCDSLSDVLMSVSTGGHPIT